MSNQDKDELQAAIVTFIFLVLFVIEALVMKNIYWGMFWGFLWSTKTILNVIEEKL